MSKHLVDIDDIVLGKARAELGTGTIKATINEALRRASETNIRQVRQSPDILAKAKLADRDEAWR